MAEPKPRSQSSQPKQPKPPQDPYARRLKTLTSEVQRLRGWTSSDPTRRDELVDALVGLNAHRLLGHLHRAAAGDAQECVRSAVELMLARGPVGPYTRLEDAVRCGRAMIQLAAVQAGMGLPEAAARSLGSWAQLRAQIAAVGLRPSFDPVTVGWALTGSARVALAAGETGRANAYADAALTRLAESGLRTDPDVASFGLLGVDADRLASDCRWAAGRSADALGFLHRAKDAYDGLVDGRLSQPGRYPPALIERLAEPLFGLYRDHADRLTGTGETDLALVVRRNLIETLRGLDGRLPAVPVEASPPVQLVAALTDLTGDLLAVDRLDEARRAADEAVVLADRPGCTGTSRLLAHVMRSRVSIAGGRAADVIEPLGQTLSEESEASAAASAWALRTLAAAMRIGSGNGGGDGEAATAMERQAGQLMPEVPVELLPALARGVIPLGAAPVDWAPLDADEGYGPTVAEVSSEPADSAQLEAERAEAHRIEQVRLTEARREEETRRVAAEAQAQAAARREEAQRIEAAAAARRETEARAVAEEAEQAERKRRREERLREHRREVESREAELGAARRREIGVRIAALEAGVVGEAEAREVERLRFELADLAGQPDAGAGASAPAGRPETAAEVQPEPAATIQPEPGIAPDHEPAPEPDEVETARERWQQARADGDRRAARTALEQLIELLRPRAQDDPVRWGLQLRTALEDLASARLRAGDLFGSRSAAREAKAVSRSLGF